MCLAIPARLIEYLDDDRQFGKVELGGVIRKVNTSLLIGEDACELGDNVLVHVGFALSRVSEEEAAETLRLLEAMGPAYEDELDQIRQWQQAESDLMGEAVREWIDETRAEELGAKAANGNGNGNGHVAAGNGHVVAANGNGSHAAEPEVEAVGRSEA